MTDGRHDPRRRVVWLVGSTLLGVVLQGCGGAAAPPASPAPAVYEPSLSAGAPAGAVSPVTPQAPPPPPPAPGPPTDLPSDRESQRRAASNELDQAARDLDLASSSCESACRALASMERATTHLCSLADQPDDQRRCDDARQRLLAARTRVRAACGTCG
jgi:hypothetical protein